MRQTTPNLLVNEIINYITPHQLVNKTDLYLHKVYNIQHYSRTEISQTDASNKL